MSKFFQAASELSDYSSSEEEDLYGSSSSLSEALSSSEESDVEVQSPDDEEAKPLTRNRFLKGQAGSDSESDSDDERVVVKSAKTKAIDEANAAAASVITSLSEKDWIQALSHFDTLVKMVEKTNRQYTVVPSAFLAALNAVEAAKSDDGEKLSASMSKAQNVLTQRQKKVAREFADQLSVYTKDPSAYNESAPPLPELEPVVPQFDALNAELTSATVFLTLSSVIENRGRKSTDSAEQVDLLERQLEVASTAYQKLCLLLMLVPAKFDIMSSNAKPAATATAASAHPDFALWHSIEADIRALLTLLESQSEYAVLDSAAEPEDWEREPKPENGVKFVPGSVPTLVERLDDEHARILATYDPHTTEYLERLKDETRLEELILRAQCYQEKALASAKTEFSQNAVYCRLLSRRLDHIYYKPLAAVQATEWAAWCLIPGSVDSSVTPRPKSNAISAIKLVDEISAVLFKQSNMLLRARAVLAKVYQLSLNDDFYGARDLLLRSHLQSQIHNSDAHAQVLFNRALVQVGLCAFRAGLVSETLVFLQELCFTSRLRELLGQAPVRDVAGPAAPVLLPYHMHINLELIECVYLTSSLLIEIPFLANVSGLRSAQNDLRKRSMNRPFRRLLDQHDRQVFTGPSETTRECVIQAAKALQTSDWQKSLDLLAKIKVWDLLSPVDARASVLRMIELQLKQAALKTHLFAFCTQAYDTLSLAYLAEDFDLTVVEVRRLLVKMIAQDEIAALLDESSEYLVFKPEADAPRAQTLALALLEKTQQMLDRNERLATDGHMPELGPKRATRTR